MTEKDSITGRITIKEGALRPKLETTPIRAGEMAEMAFRDLSTAIHHVRCAAHVLLHYSEASNRSLRGIAEAEELLNNLKVRLDFEDPEHTAIERL